MKNKKNLTDKESLTDALLCEVGCTCPDIGKMRTLLESGADPNIPAGLDTPALHILASRPAQELDAARLLIEFGADINKSRRDGTALSVSLCKGNIKMAELLLEKKADPNIDGRPFNDPVLAVAAEKGYEKIVLMLLRQGGNLHALTEAGQTAEERARTTGQTKIVEILSAWRMREERHARAREERLIRDADLINRGMPTHRPLQTSKRISIRNKPF
jgi:ankyrin repeat protein